MVPISLNALRTSVISVPAALSSLAWPQPYQLPSGILLPQSSFTGSPSLPETNFWILSRLPSPFRFVNTNGNTFPHSHFFQNNALDYFLSTLPWFIFLLKTNYYMKYSTFNMFIYLSSVFLKQNSNSIRVELIYFIDYSVFDEWLNEWHTAMLWHQ